MSDLRTPALRVSAPVKLVFAWLTVAALLNLLLPGQLLAAMAVLVGLASAYGTAMADILVSAERGRSRSAA